MIALNKNRINPIWAELSSECLFFKKMKRVFIVAAKRTAFGTYGGTLKAVIASDLGACASKAAIEQLGIFLSALVVVIGWIYILCFTYNRNHR